MVSKAQIEATITKNGGYTRETLAKWGVSWPPPVGWKERLIRADLEKKATRMIKGDAADRRSVIRWEKLSQLGYESYAEYLESPHWKAVRLKFWARHAKRCEACLTEKGPIHLHHRTYDRVGNEPLSDLVAVCERCHAEIHRRTQGRKGLSLQKATSSVLIGKEKARRRRARKATAEVEEIEPSPAELMDMEFRRVVN